MVCAKSKGFNQPAAQANFSLCLSHVRTNANSVSRGMGIVVSNEKNAFTNQENIDMKSSW